MTGEFEGGLTIILFYIFKLLAMHFQLQCPIARKLMFNQ